MATTRELLTLQCGSFANFVGAHFWNAQEAMFGKATRHQGERTTEGLAGMHSAAECGTEETEVP